MLPPFRWLRQGRSVFLTLSFFGLALVFFTSTFFGLGLAFIGSTFLGFLFTFLRLALGFFASSFFGSSFVGAAFFAVFGFFVSNLIFVELVKMMIVQKYHPIYRIEYDQLLRIQENHEKFLTLSAKNEFNN